MHVSFPKCLLSVCILNREIQSTVCRHSSAGFHDGSGSGGSRIRLQSKGEKVHVCFSWPFHVTRQITPTHKSRDNLSTTDNQN